MSYIAGNPALTCSRQTWEGAATQGQTVIPIPGGFAPGMCDVYVGGACQSGTGSNKDFDDSSGTQIVLSQAMAAGTQYRVVVFAPGQTLSNNTQYRATLNWVLPAAGTNFIPFAHVVGFAWPMQRGVFLQPEDYTEDTTGFYLATITTDGVEKFAILNVNPLTIANSLPSTSPIIVAGGLTFADGTVQNTASPTGRNYIIDGNFDLWNAGATAMTGGGSYSPCGMYFYSAGGGSGYCTISPIKLSNYSGFGALTQPAVNALRMQQTTVGNTTPWITQRLEGVRILHGKSATFSTWLWTSDGNTYTISKVVAQQAFGTGGSAMVGLDPVVNWVVGPTPKRFSVRIDFPSVVGQTIGSNYTDYVHIGLYFPNQTFDIAMAQWQLEESSPNSSGDRNGAGGMPTPFEWRGLAAELVRYQRFYQAVVGPGRCWGAITGTSTADFNYYPPVSFRNAPAVSLINSGTGSFMESMPFITAVNATYSLNSSHNTSAGPFDFQVNVGGSPSPAITPGWPATWTGGVIFDARF